MDARRREVIKRAREYIPVVKLVVANLEGRGSEYLGGLYALPTASRPRRMTENLLVQRRVISQTCEEEARRHSGWDKHQELGGADCCRGARGPGPPDTRCRRVQFR